MDAATQSRILESRQPYSVAHIRVVSTRPDNAFTEAIAPTFPVREPYDPMDENAR